MRIRAGYQLSYDLPQPTPMLLVVNVHPDRAADLRTPGPIVYEPFVPARTYQDRYGNICTRIVAPVGRLTISTDFIIEDSGLPDEVAPDARQHPIEELPDEMLLYLLGSRYCETDRLSDTAWSLFGHRRRAGLGCRRSASSCTATSPLATSSRGRRGPRGRAIRSGSGCAATSRIWRSRCAAA